MTDPEFDKEVTGFLVIDPYNDFVSEGGKIWDRIKSVAEANDYISHMLQLLTAARKTLGVSEMIGSRESTEPTKQRTVSTALISVAILMFSISASGQVSLPPVNLGNTSFQDGIAFPGWLLEELPIFHHATKWKDSNGADIAGTNSANSLTSLTHIAFISQHRIFGGFYAAELFLPIANVHLNTIFGPTYRTEGVGDLTVGPIMLQWNDAKLFGRPFFQRADLDIVVPTGQYSGRRPVNIGNNLVSVNPNYAFTVVATNKLEFSGRLHYLWNGENNSPFVGLGASSIQPGQALHQNFASSYAVYRGLRIGLNGYALEQITDHRMNGGPLPNSRESVFAIGPGSEITFKKTWFLYLDSYFETFARNRPQGATYVVRLSEVIGPKDRKRDQDRQPYTRPQSD
jgi:hypothetical protein